MPANQHLISSIKTSAVRAHLRIEHLTWTSNPPSTCDITFVYNIAKRTL
jgi:hypothetical protein